MAEEKYNLKWNEYKDVIVSSFRNLRCDEDFLDVSLFCKEDVEIKAHRTVLATSSPIFKSLLRKMKNVSHPVVYMTGMEREDLLSVIDFIYNGEANVSQERLSNF